MQVITNLLKKGIISIVILAVALGVFLIAGVNKGYDYTGGTTIAVDIRSTSENDARTKVNDVLKTYNIATTSFSIGMDNTGDKIITIKYQNKDEAVNENVKKDLYSAFGYSSTDELEKTYVSLTQNLEPAYTSKILLTTMIAILTLLVACAIYIGFRYGIASAVLIIVAGIIDAVTMLALLIITRIPFGVEIGYTLFAVTALSLIFNTFSLHALRNNALDINNKKLSNKEIASLTFKTTNKQAVLFGLVIVAIFVAFGLFTVGSGASFACFGIVLGMIGVYISSQFITPNLWALTFVRKYREEKINKPKFDEGQV